MTTGEAGRDLVQIKFRRGNLAIYWQMSRQIVLTHPVNDGLLPLSNLGGDSAFRDRTLAGRRCDGQGRREDGGIFGDSSVEAEPRV